MKTPTRFNLLFAFVLVCSLYLTQCSRPTEPEFDNPYDRRSDSYIPGPDLNTLPVEEITAFTARTGGQFTTNYGLPVQQKGVCWSINENPTIEDSCTNDGPRVQTFTSHLTGLFPEQKYYVRAYATNEDGTVYGGQRNFTTDGGLQGIVTNPATGRTWMNYNLGASHSATSSNDSRAYGDLYQWGRAADGHEKRESPTSNNLSGSDTPGHGSFILTQNTSADWRSPQNDNLWQGVNGINNPCPDGYRLPSLAEWNAEMQSWSSNNAAGAFASPLKLPVAGSRSFINGSFIDVNTIGRYWSGSVDANRTQGLFFSSNEADMDIYARAYGFSVRCIKD